MYLIIHDAVVSTVDTVFPCHQSLDRVEGFVRRTVESHEENVLTFYDVFAYILRSVINR